MEVTVTLFGGLQAVAGWRSRAVDLPDGSTVGSAVTRLIEDVPALAPHLQGTVFSVGSTLARPHTPLVDGCELGLLPPVCGG